MPSAPYTLRVKVRPYELDAYGHVNNAVYLNYAEHIATEHTESLGIGKTFCDSLGGGWVVRRHEITYRQPAMYGDELTTQAEDFKGATGMRRTTIKRVKDGVVLAEVSTEWVWLKIPDMRPARVPGVFLEKLGG